MTRRPSSLRTENAALASALAVVGVVMVAAPARAEEPSSPSGRERERTLDGDSADEAADAALFVPRAIVNNLLRAQTLAARFAFDTRLVPTDENTRRRPRVYAFPTLFVETSRSFSVGGRMLTVGGPFATTHRIGFGGPDDLVAENGVQIAERFGDVVVNITMEGLAEQKSDLEHFGLGPTPDSDSRNRFLTSRTVGLYDEKRTRVLGAVAVRPLPQLEVAGSFTATRRIQGGADDAGAEALSNVLDPALVTLWGPDTWLGYGELALRVDTREISGPPRPGFVAETYAGYANELKGRPIRYIRSGGRVQGFIPIARRSNLLALRLIFDGVHALVDEPLPFSELAGQPAFRGEDRQRDKTSYVSSVEYIWQFSSVASTRLFVDFTTVAPAVDELQLEGLRWAVGSALELHSATSDVAQLTVAGSPDGVHLRLDIGGVDNYGDRQRRD